MNRAQFNIIVFLSSMLFIACAWLTGHPNDISTWRVWTVHLGCKGFHDFLANYPPLYMEWLWLLSRFFMLLRIPILHGFLFKLLLQLPMFIAHLSVLLLLRRVCSDSKDPLPARLAILFYAFNPVIFLDGPIWGQTDLLPSAIVLWSAYLAMRGELRLSLILYVIAILTKFQAIIFLPLLAVIWMRKRVHLEPAVIISFILLLIIIYPYISGGNLGIMFTQAYLRAPTYFPVTAMHGASLWNLLIGNEISHDAPLFGLAALKVRYVALFLYGLCAAWICMLAWKTETSDEKHYWRLMVFSALGFFTLSTGMHERYLFFAVPCAAVWAAFGIGQNLWFVVLSLLTFINMAVFFPFDMDKTWKILSLLVLIAFVSFALQLAGWNTKIRAWAENIFAKRVVNPYVIAIILWVLVVAIAAVHERRGFKAGDISTESERMIYLTNLIPNSMYGRLRIDASVDNNMMHIGGYPFARGLGAHAPSEIQYDIPRAARHFFARVGIDDEVGAGEVEFSVLVDDELAWSSGPVDANSESKECLVNVAGKSKLTLRASTLGPDFCDHADWAIPRFYF